MNNLYKKLAQRIGISDKYMANIISSIPLIFLLVCYFTGYFALQFFALLICVYLTLRHIAMSFLLQLPGMGEYYAETKTESSWHKKYLTTFNGSFNNIYGLFQTLTMLSVLIAILTVSPILAVVYIASWAIYRNIELEKIGDYLLKNDVDFSHSTTMRRRNEKEIECLHRMFKLCVLDNTPELICLIIYTRIDDLNAILLREET